jgi:hypothetical protein
MGGKRRLAADRPRLLGREDGPEGSLARRTWDALRMEFDLSRPLARQLAGRVIVATVNADASTRALATARRQREHGRGRRPFPRVLERLARRQGLDEGTLGQALDRLRAVAPAARNGAGVLDAYRQRVQAPGVSA